METLVDLRLPVEVAELPADLAGLDRLLEGRALLGLIVASWELVPCQHAGSAWSSRTTS